MKIRNLPQWLLSRARKRACTTIVLHASAGSSLAGAVSTLIKRNLSYHYLIEKSGSITKCVPASKVAFHAGKSLGPQRENVNGYSIGISFVNKNDGKDPVTIEQYIAARDLIIDLRKQFPELKWVTTHYAISPGRKTDPKPMNLAKLRAFAKEVGLSPWM